jgi:enoyl-CoA hydratase
MTDADAVLIERYGPVTIVSINRPHCRRWLDGANGSR